MLQFCKNVVLVTNKKSVFPIYLRNIFISKCKLAPKGKSGKKVQDKKDTENTTESSEKAHVFNIYNTIDKDHEILPDYAYPKWLWKLEKPLKTYGELALMFLYGKDIENATAEDYHRFRRLHNKNLIKLNNLRLKKSKRSTVKPIFWDL
ncbi:mitochondrial ribosomal protein L37, putative [Plasmodium relictum]|uniref:Large ribosomal subunit protein mL54 n=1 Tax=Plasmodium relictum TaxID=85471 RepID=A0A1J1H5Z5_PLARL|nr:mitochondrial ribosomal protein L37, putative [Plasmodium relictum]CRH00105.1 mitochondrial ribosomal protein L37, putative [Plasmodium relictum]